MNADYVSREFFHFVGFAHPTEDEANYVTLSKILESQTVSHAPHSCDWGTTSYTRTLDGNLWNETLIKPTATCYCDIPIDSLGIHIGKYGKFGLSFPREYVIHYGARPVIYVPMKIGDWMSPYGRTLLKDIESIYKGFMHHLGDTVPLSERFICQEPTDRAAAIGDMRATFEKDFLAFIKPFDATLSENDPRNFYMEREWRKYGNLQFTPDKVNRVVVPTAYLERLAKDFPDYKAKAIPI